MKKLAATVWVVGVGCASSGAPADPPSAPASPQEAPTSAEVVDVPAAEPSAAATSKLRLLGTAAEQESADLAGELQKLSAAGTPERVEIHARYALAWGCPCAPIVLADATGSPPNNSYILPVTAKGDANPADFAVIGSFRLVGKYAAEQMSREAWLISRGTPEAPSGIEDRDMYLKMSYPTFLIDTWCYAPSAHLAELEGQTDAYAQKTLKLVADLRAAGRFCKPDAL